MALRRDALRAAARAIEALYEEVARENMGVHASAARISVYPNSPNVVAGRARKGCAVLTEVLWRMVVAEE